MVTRVTRLLFIAWFLALAALLARGQRHGWSAAVWLGLYLLVLGHPTLLALELALARRVGARGNVPAPGARGLLRAWAGEWLASTLVFGWRLPWRANAVADHLPREARGRRGVVFIHGYICNRGIWNPWLARLTALDRAFVAVDLEPVFGSIDLYTATVERAVQRVEAHTGLAPIIVTHSMGGLVARAWLRSRASATRIDGQQHAARIVTIGTPHRGTWLAKLALSTNARQMRTGSDWMRALAAAEPAPLAGAFTCWWSECDQIVFPPPTAELPGAEGRLIRATGHLALAGREAIWGDLRRLLDL
jgi:triacylglycerol lipase